MEKMMSGDSSAAPSKKKGSLKGISLSGKSGRSGRSNCDKEASSSR